MANNKPILEARGIVKRFGGVTALGGVDVALSEGEIAALVGDNGAGKSTFVKILSGVHPPDECKITIDDRPVRIETPMRALHLGISTGAPGPARPACPRQGPATAGLPQRHRRLL